MLGRLILHSPAGPRTTDSHRCRLLPSSRDTLSRRRLSSYRSRTSNNNSSRCRPLAAADDAGASTNSRLPGGGTVSPRRRGPPARTLGRPWFTHIACWCRVCPFPTFLALVAFVESQCKTHMIRLQKVIWLQRVRTYKQTANWVFTKEKIAIDSSTLICIKKI